MFLFYHRPTDMFFLLLFKQWAWTKALRIRHLRVLGSCIKNISFHSTMCSPWRCHISQAWFRPGINMQYKNTISAKSHTVHLYFFMSPNHPVFLCHHLLFLPSSFPPALSSRFTSPHPSLTPPSSSPPSFCLSFSYPFIKSLLSLLLNSSWPLSPSISIRRSLRLCFYQPAQSLQLSSLPPSIYLSALLPFPRLISIAALALNADSPPSLSHFFFLRVPAWDPVYIICSICRMILLHVS